MKRIVLFLCTFLTSLVTVDSANGEIRGRADIAPLWMQIKLQANGKTVSTVNMWGGRFDATILPFKGYGVCLKPFVFGGRGDHSNLVSWGSGLGHYTPINDRITVVPLVGVSHTNLHTRIDLPIPNLGIVLSNQKEKIESNSFYIGGEVIFKICDCLYLTGIYNYGWARVQTEIGTVVKSKGSSSGSNYAALLDYYITDCLSTNIGFGYNTSLDKERHGIKGLGVKLGLAYTF